MKDILNEELIEAVKRRLLPDRSLAGVLMETLSLGKEAVYRRLRGEVAFSFYEVVKISQAMGLSLDEVATNSVMNGALFSMNLKRTENPFDYFFSICNNYRDIYIYMKDDPLSVVNSAANTLLFVFHAKYKMLTKFRLCRWLHQYQELKEVKTMESIEIPEKLMEVLDSLSTMILDVPVTNIIWDSNLFLTLVNDIKYFADLGFISVEGVNELKSELMQLLDEIENTAYQGCYPTGNKVNIYVSNVHFESSYTYMEKPGFQIGMFHLYSIDYIHSHHPDVCTEQKRWIESLKRYSTLISQCDERHRVAFFSKQREYVNLL